MITSPTTAVDFARGAEIVRQQTIGAVAVIERTWQLLLNRVFEMRFSSGLARPHPAWLHGQPRRIETPVS